MTQIQTAMGITCPSCNYNGSTEGEHGDGFRYLEDIVSHRQVIRLVDGVLQVTSRYETGEGYDDGQASARLECRNCLEEFPLPAEVKEFSWL